MIDISPQVRRVLRLVGLEVGPDGYIDGGSR
jgi:hypothetical protein